MFFVYSPFSPNFKCCHYKGTLGHQDRPILSPICWLLAWLVAEAKVGQQDRWQKKAQGVCRPFWFFMKTKPSESNLRYTNCRPWWDLPLGTKILDSEPKFRPKIGLGLKFLASKKTSTCICLEAISEVTKPLKGLGPKIGAKTSENFWHREERT